MVEKRRSKTYVCKLRLVESLPDVNFEVLLVSPQGVQLELEEVDLRVLAMESLIVALVAVIQV